jgi:ribosome maturation factor RimP
MNWQAAVESTVTGLGYDLVDCERVTRQLQHVLEVEGVPYERLEVSSPGLDRPLNKAADYARFTGQEIELTLKEPFQGRKKYKGLLEVQGEGWRLVFTAGKVEQALDFSLDEVKEARLVPVLDFKGKRFQAQPEQAAPGAQVEADETDGDRKQ